ncbi:CD1375 family protein [Paenibacillus sp. CAU 1782]
MAKIYYDLIKSNHREITDVPLRWRSEVQTLIDAADV